MATRDCLDAALAYANRGWAVFPLNGKVPIHGTRGHLDATTDRKTIRRWWKEWPDANVGIACDSQRGPIVVDIDGPSGHTLLDTLSLPLTREAASGRPGRKHLYFDPARDRRAVPRIIKIKVEGIKHDFDILGDGGYVVAPPSIHPETKKRYRWLHKRRPKMLPRSVLRLLDDHIEVSTLAAPLPKVIHEGQRDNLLTSLAGSMRRRGASEEAILAALREENATRVEPPLPDRDLRRIAKSIARKPPAGAGEHYTDLGNARRFVAQYHERIRSLTGLRRAWLVWEGPRWTGDSSGEADRFAKNVVRSLYTEAEQMSDPDAREALLKHAHRSEQASKIRAMLELASTEPEVAMSADAFDANPWLFNVENGTLNLRTGKLQPHRREDLITKLAPVEFSVKATAPRWDAFLLDVAGGDTSIVEYLQRIIGYAMTGDTREQCLFFCYGRGGNGKSTFFEIIRELFGGYAQQADFGTFLARKSDGPRNDLARMRGARLITAIEGTADREFDGTVVKQLTGNDTIVARRLYEEHFEFRPEHKLFLAANHKPIVKEQTDAFWRRIRLIPFTVAFEGKNRKKLIAEKLKKELPGILNWALAGCLAWQKKGLQEPAVIRTATRAYRRENDLLGEFMEQRCAFDTTAWTPATELYRAFGDWWLETRGPRMTPPGMGWFNRLLGEKQVLEGSTRDGHPGWSGITVVQEVK